MSSPHMNVILQCKEIVKALPIEVWDKLPTQNKRLSALVARWAIERAFTAVFISRNEPIPPTCSLVELHTFSGIGLNKDQQECLETSDREITSQEPEDEDSTHWNGYNCCQLARGVVDTVLQSMVLHSFRHVKSI